MAGSVKIWLDDLRTASEGYIHCYSVFEAKIRIEEFERASTIIQVIDCDHDLGSNSKDGDGIQLLDWLVERGTLYPIKLHTMNPVGRANMQRMIERYW